jgi:hypothetical protein
VSLYKCPPRSAQAISDPGGRIDEGYETSQRSSTHRGSKLRLASANCFSSVEPKGTSSGAVEADLLPSHDCFIKKHLVLFRSLLWRHQYPLVHRNIEKPPPSDSLLLLDTVGTDQSLSSRGAARLTSQLISRQPQNDSKRDFIIVGCNAKDGLSPVISLR